MYYALYQDETLVTVVKESPFTGTPKLREIQGVTYNRVTDNWDWTEAEAKAVAAKASEVFGVPYDFVDSGCPGLRRYDIVSVPQVGDKVSYAFNGDCYPDGVIVKVTTSGQIKTDTGSTYRRRKQTACWVKSGGTFCLVSGHHYEQNPHL